MTAGQRAETLGNMPAQYKPLPTTPVEELLCINDVAQVLRKSRGFVYALVRDGELHPVRVGMRLRFSAPDVRAYLERLGVRSP
jgi:excisionase family DNA binding protein